jgi:hypothetical protein
MPQDDEKVIYHKKEIEVEATITIDKNGIRYKQALLFLKSQYWMKIKIFKGH